ncbi:hypothetical protein AB0C34_20555 [Nocardia sp. NPDC049220]|uniref:hypothetical protein n=1 Tax=Nocardia sp. NPDC049220 TaxID=3155273 RepID=UPI0033E6C24D
MVDLDLDAIGQWATEVSAAADQRLFSRHIDDFGLSAESMRDPSRLLASSASAFGALCNGVDWPNRAGIAACLVLPLEVTQTLPSPRSVLAGIDFLRTYLDRNEPPGLYLLPAGSLSQWSDRDEDHRYPFDPRSVVDIPVDSAFVRYYRSDDEIAHDDVYSGAIYLIRSPTALSPSIG